MKIIIFTILLSISICYEQNSYTGILKYSNNNLEFSGKGVEIFGSNANIINPGSYLAIGICSEGRINIISDSVSLYLQNLELSSSISSPIFVERNLENIQIIAIENVVLNDYEEFGTTGGECSVIKIKKNSKVVFRNKDKFLLNGKCKNVIKGASKTTISFDSSNGEYIINGYQNGIVSENLLIFNGSKFNIITTIGDAVQAKPDENDTISLGKIIVNDGDFNIHSKGDGFQAKNNIEIRKGNFNIKTENGYNSTTFVKYTGSSKGFKICNNENNCQIKIYDGNFFLNTPDDSFHSDGNLTVINGNYTIYSGDDAFHASFHLMIGKKESSEGPNITIYNSFEAIEGAYIRIYSGNINSVSLDDGINAVIKNKSLTQFQNEFSYIPFLENREYPYDENNITPKNFISIYGGNLNLFSKGNGLNSKGNIFIHGGNINIFSDSLKKKSIKHLGNFTLFSSTIVCLESESSNQIHEEILKGNQFYAFYNKSIESKKILKIKNEINSVIKELTIGNNINYIFFSSLDLNEKYSFYLTDKNGYNEEKYDFIIKRLNDGEDDQDIFPDDDGNDEDEPGDKGKNKKKKLAGWAISLIVIVSLIIFLFLVLLLYIIIKHNCVQKNNYFFNS